VRGKLARLEPSGQVHDRIEVAPAVETIAATGAVAVDAATAPIPAAGARRPAPTDASPVSSNDAPPPGEPASFVRNSGWAIAARVCMAACRGVGLVLISRALGAEAFGDYSLLLAAFAVGSGVGTFGLDQAHVYLTGLQRPVAVRMLVNVLWLAAAMGVVVAAALLGAVHGLRERIFDTVPRDAVLATALMLPAILHHNYVAGMIVGRSWFRWYGASEIAKWGLHVGALALLAGHDRLTVRSALLALYVPIAVAGVVHHVVLLRSEHARRSEIFGRPDLGLLRRSVSYGARAWLVSVGQLLHLRLDVYLVKYFTSAATVGHYALATNIADVILYGGRSIGLVLFARSAVDPGPVAALVPRVTRVVAVVVAAIAAVVAVGREFWIGLFFGAQYLACTTAIACRLPGIVAESMSLVLVGDFMGRARAVLVLVPTAAAVAVGVALNAWLVPVGGIAAAASAFTVASFLRAGGLVALHARMTGQPWFRYGIASRADLCNVLRGLRRRRAS
jgi:O-antigen/teichoic acid export membrane protein